MTKENILTKTFRRFFNETTIRYVPPIYHAARYYYAFPNLLKRKVSISGENEKYLKELKENGIVVIPPHKFSKIADHINENYISLVENFPQITESPFVYLVDDELNIDRIRLHISFKDNDLKEIFLSEELSGLIYNYLGRQPYYRNYPYVIFNRASSDTKDGIFQKFHKDRGFHQITLMMLLNDITEADTHMQYALKSHKKWVNPKHIRDRYSYDDKDIYDEFDILNCVGKKGTLFIFDAGNGFHKNVKVPGTQRNIFHANITTGMSIQKGRYDSRDNWDTLDKKPDHVQNMFNKIVT